MPRYLVAYYSWTGHTAKVAKAIAETLSADIEQIHDLKPRGGPLAFPATAFASVLQRSAPIAMLMKNAADYDVVILGGPVWAGNVATPIRSYITREGPKIKQLGLFCTLGGSGGKAALGRMAALCGRTPIADLLVEQSTFTSDAWRTLTASFVLEVQKKTANVPNLAAA